MPPELRTRQPARHGAPTARASAIAYLVFERPDLELAQSFLVDFGLEVVRRTDDELYLRASDESPYCYRIKRSAQSRFVGFGLTVASRSELEALQRVPGASAIESVDHPGAGERIVLRDPSGFVVEVVHGQVASEARVCRPPLAMNAGAERPRINAPQRPLHAPAQVLRLGHVVLEVADYQRTYAWYAEHLGFLPSDVQVLPDGSPAVTFMRLDLGETPADHHTIALAQGFMPAFSHAAFEVIDADAIGMGQRVLRERGWNHAWGIGRHILGSQIFDYWKDPWGDKHEHYCDGDLFSADSPLGVHPVHRDAMAQWGQAMPASFTRPRARVSSLIALVRNLLHSPDLTVRKLLTLARLFG
jgi:catechol 2,3-dioxygenase-like lactoylglutathione lyase family enzyme